VRQLQGKGEGLLTSPVTSRADYADDREALDVLERAGVKTIKGMILLPAQADLSRDQELASAIDHLCDEWDYALY
jgi:hypothetical protein